MAEGPNTNTDLVKLPDFMAGMWERENEIAREALIKINADPDSRIFMEAIDSALSTMSEILRLPHEDKVDAAVIQYLAVRIFNSSQAAVRLAYSGYCQVAWATLRDTLEVSFLVQYFRYDPSQISVWNSVEKKQRLKDYNPGAIREKLSQLLEKNHTDTSAEKEKALFKKWYDQYCEMAAHANPDGKELIFNEGAIEVGPFAHEKLLRRTLFEIAKWSQFGTLQVIGTLKPMIQMGPLDQQVDLFATKFGGWINFTRSKANLKPMEQGDGDPS